MEWVYLVDWELLDIIGIGDISLKMANNMRNMEDSQGKTCY